MSEEDFKINYRNFEPNFDEAMKIRNLASNLYFSSPSDSSLRISLEKRSRQYNCHIEVNSSQFRGKTTVSNQELIPCLLLGSEAINSKIDQWKQQRFKDLTG